MPASEQPQTHALNRTATGFGIHNMYLSKSASERLHKQQQQQQQQQQLTEI
jgi:hypothetical protein